MAYTATREEDLYVLNILDMYDRYSSPKIAKKLGMTKNTVLGKIYRVRKVEQPCRCIKPENKDGGMPNRWWEKC